MATATQADRLAAAKAARAAKRAAHAELMREELANPSFPPRLLLCEYAERCPACRAVIERCVASSDYTNLVCRACGWQAVEVSS